MRRVTVGNVSLRYHTDLGTTVSFAPLEALYVAEALERNGYEVDFRDHQLLSMDQADPTAPDFFAEVFLADAEDTILLICNNESLPVTVLGMRRLKETCPEKRVILGGIGAAGVGRHLLEQLPWVDLVVEGSHGENGESASPETFAALIEREGPLFDDVPGVAFRWNGQVVSSPPRQPRSDLVGLPFPAYHLTDLDRYTVVLMRTSWGCPFLCSYCDRHRGGLLSLRPIEDVITEIRYLVSRFGQRRAFFYDETFTLNRSRVLDFCWRLERLGLPFQWSCTGRVDTVDEEMLRAMAGSGCELIYYGLESGSDAVLQRLKGNLTQQQVEKALEVTLRHMAVGAFFIWGFPFETVEDARMTLEFARRVQHMGCGITVYSFSAWPQSELYVQYRDKLVFRRQWWEENWPRYLTDPHSREQLANLIAAHRDVFPGFHTADDFIMEKLKLVQEMGFESHFSD